MELDLLMWCSYSYMGWYAIGWLMKLIDVQLLIFSFPSFSVLSLYGLLALWFLLIKLFTLRRKVVLWKIHGKEIKSSTTEAKWDPRAWTLLK